MWPWLFFTLQAICGHSLGAIIRQGCSCLAVSMQGPTAEDHAMGPAAASGLSAKGWAWLCSMYSGYPRAVLGHGFGFGPKETNQQKHSKAYLACEI